MTRIAFLAICALGALAAVALAQQAAPTENKGITPKQLSAFDLSKQGLKDYEQRQMRIRHITIAPGGVVALHSHAQRPALSYIISGTILEHRKGAADRTYTAGEVITESTDVEHWGENNGTEPVVIVSVDLFKE